MCSLPNNENVLDWTIPQVASWLTKSVGLSQKDVDQKFRDAYIEGTKLLKLDLETLVQMGISKTQALLINAAIDRYNQEHDCYEETYDDEWDEDEEQWPYEFPPDSAVGEANGKQQMELEYCEMDVPPPPRPPKKFESPRISPDRFTSMPECPPPVPPSQFRPPKPPVLKKWPPEQNDSLPDENPPNPPDTFKNSIISSGVRPPQPLPNEVQVQTKLIIPANQQLDVEDYEEPQNAPTRQPVYRPPPPRPQEESSGSDDEYLEVDPESSAAITPPGGAGIRPLPDIPGTDKKSQQQTPVSNAPIPTPTGKLPYSYTQVQVNRNDKKPQIGKSSTPTNEFKPKLTTTVTPNSSTKPKPTQAEAIPKPDSVQSTNEPIPRPSDFVRGQVNATPQWRNEITSSYNRNVNSNSDEKTKVNSTVPSVKNLSSVFESKPVMTSKPTKHMEERELLEKIQQSQQARYSNTRPELPNTVESNGTAQCPARTGAMEEKALPLHGDSGSSGKRDAKPANASSSPAKPSRQTPNTSPQTPNMPAAKTVILPATPFKPKNTPALKPQDKAPLVTTATLQAMRSSKQASIQPTQISSHAETVPSKSTPMRPLPSVPTDQTAAKEDVPPPVPNTPRPRRDSMTSTGSSKSGSEEDELYSYPWFFPDLTREGEKRILQPEDSPQDGHFVVRKSAKDPNNPYTLVVVLRSELYHLNIRKRHDGTLGLGSEKRDEMTYKTVAALVEFHKTNNILLSAPGKTGGKTPLTTFPLKRSTCR